MLIGTAQAAVIENAPTLGSVLTNAFMFLLSIVGVLGIIGLVVVAVLYLTAAGDKRRIFIAKRGFWAIIVGLLIALGAWVIVRQITEFFL